MKKLFSFILLLCLFIPCSIVMTACGDNDSNDVIALKILLNGEELSLYECVWDNIDGNEEVITKDDITILKIYEDTTEVPVFLRDCNVSFSDGINTLEALDFWESGETELTLPGTYNISISNSGASSNFDVKINKMDRTYGDVSINNGTDTIGFGGFENSYTLDWNYNQYKNLCLGGIAESEPYGDEKASITHYYVKKANYDVAVDKSSYYQSNKTLCPEDFTKLEIGSYYIFAEFSETTYFKSGVSTSPLCLTINARNFEPVKTSLSVDFDVNKLISKNVLKENAENINLQYSDIENEVNALFPQFDNYGIDAFNKLSYYVFEDGDWTKIQTNMSDIKVNALNLGGTYYLVKYDFQNEKWTRYLSSAEVDETHIEIVNYSQIQDYKDNKYIEIPLYCMFNSEDLSNEFYYSTYVDKIFNLTLNIKKAQIKSKSEHLGTFIIEELGYDVKPNIKNAIDNLMIINNNENVKFLYTYPTALDGIAPGFYSLSVNLISNPNICWDSIKNFSFYVRNKDCLNPIIDILNFNSYNRNITANFDKEIKTIISFNSPENVSGISLNIDILENDNEIKTYSYQLEFKDKVLENDTFKNLVDSRFECTLLGDNVIKKDGYYSITNAGKVTLLMNIYDSFNNKGTSEIEFKFFNTNDNYSEEKPIIIVDFISDEEISFTGNTIYSNPGILNIEILVCSIDGSYDYSSMSEVSVSIESKIVGIPFAELGNYSYKFEECGTFYITINAELTDGRKADAKVVQLIVEKPEIRWLNDFDVPTFASRGETVKLPDASASNGAIVSVKVVFPGASSDESIDAVKVPDQNGYVYWTFTTSETSKGTYTIIYTASNDYDVLTRTFSIKVGDNVAPTISIQNKGKLEKDVYFDGVNDIKYNIEVSKLNKTFIVDINGNRYDLGLVLSDKDDAGSTNSNMSWSNLTYGLSGSSVTNLSTITTDNTTTTRYSISGLGQCCLTLSIKDSYDNISNLKIYFNVVDNPVQDEEEIILTATCKGFIVKSTENGQFVLNDLGLMPGSYLKFSKVSVCNIDGLICKTTSMVSVSYGVIQLTNYDDSAYVILEVRESGSNSFIQYIQLKVYR